MHFTYLLTYGVLTDGVNQPRQRDRRPEELDEVVAQLNNLGGLGPPSQVGLGVSGGRPSGGAGHGGDVPQRPLIVDDGSDDDDDNPPAADGTLLASTPARPL